MRVQEPTVTLAPFSITLPNLCCNLLLNTLFYLFYLFNSPRLLLFRNSELQGGVVCYNATAEQHTHLTFLESGGGGGDIIEKEHGKSIADMLLKMQQNKILSELSPSG